MIGKFLKWLRRLGSNTDYKIKKSGSGVSKRGLSAEDWIWDRVDEYPYSHYSEAIEEIKQLKRENAHEKVEDLLLWCIEFAEAEAEREQNQGNEFTVPPAYYRHLAIVYRKDDRYGEEVSILERYQDACEKNGKDPKDKMIDRLTKAQELKIENQII